MAASYRKAIEWIAYNDSPADDTYDAEALSGYISVVLVADLFDKDSDAVARAVVRKRRKELR
jgi:hypothetical protein